MGKRIGSILHGALGDYYEQIICLKKFKEKYPNVSLIAFIAVKNRYKAYQHFDLSFFNEIHLAEDITKVEVDEFYQFQINDSELRENIINGLPDTIKGKFDFSKNILPWTIIRKHDFSKQPLTINLGQKGKDYLKLANEINEVDDNIFDRRFKVGFLWRFRMKGKIDSIGQYPLRIVKKNLNGLIQELIAKYQAHIFVCGMNRGKLEQESYYQDIVEEAGLALGERQNTFVDFRFDVDDRHITYLKGVGYAVEMENLSKCDLIIAMPSGFSEPLWMRQRQPVVMVFPPLEYLARLWIRRMPFFDNDKWRARWFNTFTFHSSKNVMKYLKKMGYLPR